MLFSWKWSTHPKSPCLFCLYAPYNNLLPFSSLLLKSHEFLAHHHYHLIVICTMERKRSFTEKSKDKVLEEAEDEEEEEEERKGGHVAEEEKKKGVGGINRRGSSGGFKVSSASCQAERCGAKLADAKRYHRRHKVCEFHSRAPIVIVAGLRQRFCQQCSRFHDIGEFDEAKRSCRRRLAEHNERRRKSNAETRNDGGEDHHENPMEGRFRQVDDRGRRVNQTNVNGGN